MSTQLSYTQLYVKYSDNKLGPFYFTHINYLRLISTDLFPSLFVDLKFMIVSFITESTLNKDKFNNSLQKSNKKRKQHVKREILKILLCFGLNVVNFHVNNNSNRTSETFLKKYQNVLLNRVFSSE